MARTVSASLRSWMAAVSEISRAVNAAEPLESLLTRVAEQACLLIGFEFCAVMLVDETGERLLVKGWHGLSAEYVRRINTDRPLLVNPPAPGLDLPAARAFREGCTVVVPDVGSTEQYAQLRGLAPDQGYRALLAAPLRTADNPAGVVVAYSVMAHEFTRTESELVELLAEQAALAIETARLRSVQQSVITELSETNTQLRHQRGVLDWAEQQHHRLMQLVLDDVGLTGLVESLAATLQASITVEDADGRVLASGSLGTYVPPPDRSTRRRGPPRRALEALHERYEVVHVRFPDPASPGRRRGTGMGVDAWVAPVVLGGDLVGRLWLTGPRAAPDAVQRRVIERFALVVALELLKQRHAVEVEGRLSRDLLTDLIRSEGLAVHQGLTQRASALGHDLTVPHTVVLLTIDPGPATDHPGTDDPRRASRLAEAVLGGVSIGRVRPLVGVQEGAVVLLIPAGADEGGDPAVRQVARRIQQQVQHLVEPRTVSVVLGATATRLEEYATAYRVARCAAGLLRDGRPGRIVDVRDLGVHGLLLEGGLTAGLQGFAGRLLAPIEDHDARRSAGLVRTLRTWLDHECSTPATAATLVVHPNTVIYRLGRIESLLGCRLRQPQTQLQLQLALTVRDIESSLGADGGDAGPAADR
ncbi:MAG: GAF domain-containing protein [Pseudonocardiaceae bacterium]|nr:GAF domain-containing protein [Pseudonocardiaceae bacterium]